MKSPKFFEYLHPQEPWVVEPVTPQSLQNFRVKGLTLAAVDAEHGKILAKAEQSALAPDEEDLEEVREARRWQDQAMEASDGVARFLTQALPALQLLHKLIEDHASGLSILRRQAIKEVLEEAGYGSPNYDGSYPPQYP